MAIYDYEIGATVGGMVNVETIIDNAPRSIFHRWPTVYVRGDGSTEGDGLPQAEWIWDYISQTDKATLRAFLLSGSTWLKSDTMVIATLRDDGVFDDFNCIMHWPEDTEENRLTSGMYENFKIKFTHLDAV